MTCETYRVCCAFPDSPSWASLLGLQQDYPPLLLLNQGPQGTADFLIQELTFFTDLVSKCLCGCLFVVTCMCIWGGSFTLLGFHLLVFIFVLNAYFFIIFIIFTLHLLGLNFISHMSDHLSILSRSLCNIQAPCYSALHS